MAASGEGAAVERAASHQEPAALLSAALGAGCIAPAGAPAGRVADGQHSELGRFGTVGTTDGTAPAQMSITGSAPAPDDRARAFRCALAAPVFTMSAAGPMGERTP
ncbi:hypothetical protein [Actinacidiphila acididurans]|uniref:Uncharacterized protein n=1 Tax=Actinacidiphila acididurans TaxID=2784346 RepID=A0ABS2U5C9_9ACTN|nr:hypothetical protein [Actinacidiphila acididurans]MBM9510567.1 hypothetical protein [Actinacidiphila acididurans]